MKRKNEPSEETRCCCDDLEECEREKKEEWHQMHVRMKLRALLLRNHTKWLIKDNVDECPRVVKNVLLFGVHCKLSPALPRQHLFVPVSIHFTVIKPLMRIRAEIRERAKMLKSVLAGIFSEEFIVRKIVSFYALGFHFNDL